MGRFISEDPIGLAGGVNPYVFAGNDPVNRRDPSGNRCEWRNPKDDLDAAAAPPLKKNSHDADYLYCYDFIE